MNRYLRAECTRCSDAAADGRLQFKNFSRSPADNLSYFPQLDYSEDESSLGYIQNANDRREGRGEWLIILDEIATSTGVDKEREREEFPEWKFRRSNNFRARS